MKTLEELRHLIIEWAREKDLLKADNAPKQKLELLGEVGETAKAILNNDIAEIKDGLGYVFVVLVILAEQLGYGINFKFKDSKKRDAFSKIIEYSTYSTELAIDYLNDTALFYNQDLTECANLAWNEIKDRKGKTIGGTFIKNSLH